MSDREKIEILRSIVIELEKINHMISMLGDAIYLESREKKDAEDDNK